MENKAKGINLDLLKSVAPSATELSEDAINEMVGSCGCGWICSFTGECGCMNGFTVCFGPGCAA